MKTKKIKLLNSSKIKLTVNLFLLLFFITSCASKFSLQKRRYTKGYYFSSNSHSIKKMDVIVKNDIEVKKNQVEIVNEEQIVSVNVAEIKETETSLKENNFVVDIQPQSNLVSDAKTDASENRKKSITEIELQTTDQLININEFEKSEDYNQSKGANKSFNSIKSRSRLFEPFNIKSLSKNTILGCIICLGFLVWVLCGMPMDGFLVISLYAVWCICLIMLIF